MAEIEIERRPQRTGWKWLALLLLIAAVAVGAWLAFNNGGLMDGNSPPAAEETTGTPTPMSEPDRPLERGPTTDPEGSDGIDESTVPERPAAPTGAPPETDG